MQAVQLAHIDNQASHLADNHPPHSKETHASQATATTPSSRYHLPLADHKIDDPKTRLAQVLADPTRLSSQRGLYEVATEVQCLHTSREMIPKPSTSERLRERCVSIIESTGTLATISGLFFIALALPVAAGVVALQFSDADNCPEPLVPLIMSASSAAVTFFAGGLEILSHLLEIQVEPIESRDDMLIRKFLENLESRQQAVKSKESITAEDVHEKIQECINDFDNLPENLKQELPSYEEWIMWFLKTIPESLPAVESLKISSTIMKESSKTQKSNPEAVSEIVKTMLHDNATFSTLPANAGKGKEKETSNDADTVIEIPKDSILEANKIKIAKDLGASPENLKVHRVQKQVDRLRELASESSLESVESRPKFWVRLLESKKRKFAEKTMFAFSILLSGAAAVTDLIFNNANNCIKPPVVIGLDGSSIALLSVGSLIWMTYFGLKESIENHKHDDILVDRFIQALKEHATQAQNEDQIDSLNQKIRDCLDLYDQLPPQLKARIPPRDILILGLLNALPEAHPVQPALQEMRQLSTQLGHKGKPRRKRREGIDSHACMSRPLQEQIENLFKVIEEITGPIEFLAMGDICITRDYQLKSLQEMLQGNSSMTTRQSIDGHLTIGLSQPSFG